MNLPQTKNCYESQSYRGNDQEGVNEAGGIELQRRDQSIYTSLCIGTPIDATTKIRNVTCAQKAVNNRN